VGAKSASRSAERQILWFVLTQTAFGQHVRAVGQSASVARRTGIPRDRTRIIAFVIAGLCAAFTGVLLASALAGGETTAGDGYMLQSFAAAFLGSAVLRDGEFHQVGTFLGVVTVAVGFNELAILGAPTYAQYVFSGGVLVIIVAFRQRVGTMPRAGPADGERPLPSPTRAGQASAMQEELKEGDVAMGEPDPKSMSPVSSTKEGTRRLPVVEVHDVYKQFGGVHALSGVSLSIWPGETVGLVGDNGSGKSTPVNIISGVSAPSRGSLKLAAMDAETHHGG
jgi:ABC-type multidrug transport system fused ATPase/permease subunit